jgi:hypothetical protein
MQYSFIFPDFLKILRAVANPFLQAAKSNLIPFRAKGGK